MSIAIVSDAIHKNELISLGMPENLITVDPNRKDIRKLEKQYFSELTIGNTHEVHGIPHSNFTVREGYYKIIEVIWQKEETAKTRLNAHYYAAANWKSNIDEDWLEDFIVIIKLNPLFNIGSDGHYTLNDPPLTDEEKESFVGELMYSFSNKILEIRSAKFAQAIYAGEPYTYYKVVWYILENA